MNRVPSHVSPGVRPASYPRHDNIHSRHRRWVVPARSRTNGRLLLTHRRRRVAKRDVGDRWGFLGAGCDCLPSARECLPSASECLPSASKCLPSAREVPALVSACPLRARRTPPRCALERRGLQQRGALKVTAQCDSPGEPAPREAPRLRTCKSQLDVSTSRAEREPRRILPYRRPPLVRLEHPASLSEDNLIPRVPVTPKV